MVLISCYYSFWQKKNELKLNKKSLELNDPKYEVMGFEWRKDEWKLKWTLRTFCSGQNLAWASSGLYFRRPKWVKAHAKITLDAKWEISFQIFAWASCRRWYRRPKGVKPTQKSHWTQNGKLASKFLRGPLADASIVGQNG